jgi:hypothetical protein
VIDGDGIDKPNSLPFVPIPRKKGSHQDANGLVFARTTQQVLNIVYFAKNVRKGGFFPNGVNT